MAELPVPIIDIAPFFRADATAEEADAVVQQVREAGEKVGFMIIQGHGVPDAAIREAFEASREFFDLPLDVKTSVAMTPDYPYGYENGELLSRALDRPGEYGASQPDAKETFQFSLSKDPEVPGPKWPAQPASLQPALTAYFYEIEALAARLLSIFAVALGQPRNFFEDKIDRNMSALRSLNYPHQEKPPVPGTVRASAHTDYGSLTILKQGGDSPGGLQVFHKAGEWMDVAPPADAYIINLGDLMQRWTNDRWKSTMHRVVNPQIQEGSSNRRQSIAFFHNMNRDLLIECLTGSADEAPKYPPITAGEHLMRKHRAAMGHDK